MSGEGRGQQEVPILWSLEYSTKSSTQKWPEKGGAKMGAHAWVGLRCGSPTLATLQYKKSGAWGCAHHHVAPEGAHSVVLGRQHKKQHKKWHEKGGANMGGDAWVGLRCCSPKFSTLKYRVSRAWRCAHHHVAPRGAHVMVLRRHSSF